MALELINLAEFNFLKFLSPFVSFCKLSFSFCLSLHERCSLRIEPHALHHLGQSKEEYPLVKLGIKRE